MMIEELQKEATVFERKITKNLDIISPTNIHKKSFDFDDPSLTDLKSFESEPFLQNYSKIDQKFERSMKCIKNLKNELKKKEEECQVLLKRVEELSSNTRLLNLENDVLTKERSFYTDQISRFEENNNQIRKDYEKRLENTTKDLQKEISSLKEMLNQKRNLDSDNMRRLQSVRSNSLLITSDMENLTASGFLQQPANHEQAMKKKITLLEVF